MNKKIIVFICILSLIFPFLPSFNFTVHAASAGTVSDADLNDPEFIAWLYENGTFYNPSTEKLEPIANNPIYARMGYILAQHGYTIKDPFSAVIDSLQSLTNIQVFNKEGVKDLYEYAYDNDFLSVSNDILNLSISYAEDNLSYYIYDFININEFFNYYQFTNYSGVSSTLDSYKNALINLCSDSDYVYFLTNKNGSPFSYLYDTTLIKVPRSFFDDNYLVLNSGFFSDIVNYNFQSFRIPRDASSLPSNVNINGTLAFYNGFSYVTNDNFIFYNSNSINGGNDFSGFEYIFGDVSYNLRIGLINNSSGWFSNNTFSGTSFIYSGNSFSVPVFKSTNLVSDFMSGNASVYKFDKNIDLGQYGADIDYSKLYDIISDSVIGSSDNVIDAINNAANSYLAEQLELLHDINNALNDGNGQSWLRRIFSLLDDSIPLTMSKLDQLLFAINNISITGGSGVDFSEATQVLHEIDDKIAFLIDQPILDASGEDIDNIKQRLTNKFPFSIFSDIVAISVILNRPPQQPDITIPIPIVGTASVNEVHVDLSPYEYARPYVHGALIFLFIIGLLALSVKIFDSMKS